MVFSGYTPRIKAELLPILYNLFQKIEEGTFSILFYEASITLIPKPKSVQNKEKYRPIAFMNIEKNNKILVSRNQQYIKMNYTP